MTSLDYLLLHLVPNRRIASLVWALSGLAFALGLLELVTHNLAPAQWYFQLSIVIAMCLVLIQFITVRAAYACAATVQQTLTRKIRQQALPHEGEPEGSAAQERAEMANLAATLREALAGIPADSPLRPKYEATLEWLRRIEAKH